MSNTGKWKLIMTIAIVGIVAALVVLICFLALPQSSQDTQSGVSLASQSIGSSGEAEGETASLPSGDVQDGDASQGNTAQPDEQRGSSQSGSSQDAGSQAAVSNGSSQSGSQGTSGAESQESGF